MQVLCMHCIFFILNLNNKHIYHTDLQQNKKYGYKSRKVIIAENGSRQKK